VNFTYRQKFWFRLPAVFFIVVGFSIRADAHLVTTGLGPLYDGMGHMMLSPEEWIMVAGLGLLAGMGGPAMGRFVLFSLPCAWLAGGCAGHFIHLTLPSPVSAMALLIVGGLVAADVKADRNIVVAIAGVLGFLQGYLNGVSLGATNGATLALLGASVVTFVIVAFGAALAVDTKGWQRIVVRVAGSWITAIGILLVGWTIRKM
jgi:hydrogenase/urease accessory protein HupE